MSNERNWWYTDFMLESTDEGTAATSISIRNCTDKTIKIDIIPVARQGREYDLTVTAAEIAPRHSIITEVRYSTQIASSHAKSKRPVMKFEIFYNGKKYKSYLIGKLKDGHKPPVDPIRSHYLLSIAFNRVVLIPTAPQTTTTTPAEGATKAALIDCLKFFSHDKCEREFTPSTQVRLGLQMLYGLKQLHEVEYVHRDLKPANLAIEKKGKATQVVHLLDFGLSREYIITVDENQEIRKPRENTLFRGTTKYCSAHANCRGEQGRVDDLWSMVYVLAEMRRPFQWDQLRDIQEIAKLKKGTSDDKLLSKMLGIATHLRELDYHKRLDYAKLYQIMNGIMVELEIKHSDLFDWEKQPNYSPFVAKN